MTTNAYTRIYAIVRRIPSGRVASYGQVAALAGLHGRARQVGYALHALKSDAVPWHRVINAAGRISLRGPSAITQRVRLAREGVASDDGGRIDLKRFGWKPRRRPPS
jgi:methylated-DNA-protein-cysteine methyltransferase-like protein